MRARRIIGRARLAGAFAAAVLLVSCEAPAPAKAGPYYNSVEVTWGQRIGR